MTEQGIVDRSAPSKRRASPAAREINVQQAASHFKGELKTIKMFFNSKYM
jgi:hypothetical protein